MIFYSEPLYNSLAHRFNAVDVEQVGLLIGVPDGPDYHIKALIPAKNECSDCSASFFISNRQISELTRRALPPGMQVLGVIHTHPANLPPMPSQADVDNCRHPVNAVFHPASGQLVFFDWHGPVPSACWQSAWRPTWLPALRARLLPA